MTATEHAGKAYREATMTIQEAEKEISTLQKQIRKALSGIADLEKKVDELENGFDERLDVVEHGHAPKKFYRAEICEADPCRNCGGCEEWENDH